MNQTLEIVTLHKWSISSNPGDKPILFGEADNFVVREGILTFDSETMKILTESGKEYILI